MMPSGKMNKIKIIRSSSQLAASLAAKIQECSVTAICILWTALCCPVSAQTTFPSSMQSPADAIGDSYGEADPSVPWRIGASLDYSYISGGDVSFQGATGKSDAQSLNARIHAEIPINDQWFVPVGIGSRNLFLGTVAGAPIPDQINTAGFDAGLGYHFNDQWTFAGSIGPRFYRLDDIGGDDIGVGGTIRAVYRWKPNLTLVFGVNFNTRRQAPFLPAAGLRWGIRTNLTLNLMWPRPSLVYRVGRKLDVFLAGGGDFTAFRADSNLGNNIGQPQFNNALGTYRDFRVGVGADYRLRRGLSIGVEGGYSFGREIDYKDIDQTVSFGNAPYIQAGLRYRF